MGHRINALVGRNVALSKFLERFGETSSSTLTPKLSIILLDEKRLDQIAVSNEMALEGFIYLTRQLAIEIAQTLSGEKALYFETDYSGGKGGQSAAFFEGGVLRWTDCDPSNGPMAARSPVGHDTRLRRLANKSPINKALAMLGVEATPFRDEFEVVGLDRIRWMDVD